MFKDSLEDFDDSQYAIESLIKEYKAAETKNYLEWGMEEMQSEN